MTTDSATKCSNNGRGASSSVSWLVPWSLVLLVTVAFVLCRCEVPIMPGLSESWRVSVNMNYSPCLGVRSAALLRLGQYAAENRKCAQDVAAMIDDPRYRAYAKAGLLLFDDATRTGALLTVFPRLRTAGGRLATANLLRLDAVEQRAASAREEAQHLLSACSMDGKRDTQIWQEVMLLLVRRVRTRN